MANDPARRLFRRSRRQDRRRRTHLEMTARPAPRPDPAGAWTLRRVRCPRARLVSRSLSAASARPWLWISRIRMPDAELAAIIQSPLMEVHALAHEGRDEGLLEMDFREPGQCEIVSFGRHRKTRRHRRRPLADEPRAGARMVAAGHARLAAHLHLRSSRRARLLPALGLSSVPAAGRGGQRSAARWHRAARCGAACAGDRVR